MPETMPATMLNTRYGFPPIAAPNARVLILGSMPGDASLAAGAYYAHPANAFWRILGEVYGFPHQAPYADRVAALIEQRVAVWDILHACRRIGSLDSRIDPDSEIANDLAGFLSTHRDLRCILFNGAKAEQVFRRRLRESNNASTCPPLPRLLKLPSTSPAHASRTYAEKCAVWRSALLSIDQDRDRGGAD